MANITRIIEYKNDLTVYTIEGDLTANEFLRCSSESYVNNSTKNVLLDLRKGSISNISSDDLKAIACGLKECIQKWMGGKTAIVSQVNVDFGMGRMYEAFVQYENVPIIYQTFRDIEKAKKWLKTEIYSNPIIH
jgi:hypothetical protein